MPETFSIAHSPGPAPMNFCPAGIFQHSTAQWHTVTPSALGPTEGRMSPSANTPVPSCPAQGWLWGPNFQHVPSSWDALPVFLANALHTRSVLLGRGCQCACLSRTACSKHPSCAGTGNNLCIGFTSLDANQKNPFPAIVEQGVQLAVSSVLDQGRHLATAVQHAAAALCPAALILGCVQPRSAAPVLLPLRALQLGVHLGVMEQALSQGRK